MHHMLINLVYQAKSERVVEWMMVTSITHTTTITAECSSFVFLFPSSKRLAQGN